MRITLLLLAFLLAPLTTFAAPTISVVRTPSNGSVGTAETVQWSSQGATKVQYSCTGPFSGKGILVPNGSAPDTYRAEWIGTTHCEWWAVDSDGVASAKVSDTFTVTAANTAQNQNGGTFSITKVNGQEFTGQSVLIPKDTRGFVLEGTGVPGAYVVVGEVKVSSGFVEGNVTVGDDGKWKMTFLNNSYPEGVHYFTLDGYKPYTTVSANITFSFTVAWSQSVAKPEGIKCLANGNATDSNTYVLYGQTVECSVVTSDPNTKAMLSSGYTHWGDVSTTKIVEPRWFTIVPGSYLNGVYTVKITGDYHGYNLTRDLWFENAAGKTSTLSIGMSDPKSDDYVQATAYLDKQRTAYDQSQAENAAQVINGPVQVFGTLGITVMGKTAGVGLAPGITVSQENGKTVIRGLPSSVLTDFSAKGFGPSGQTLVVKSDRHNKVIRADIRKKTSATDTGIGWWVDSAGVQDADSRLALKNFLVSGRNVIHFGAVDQSGKETSGMDVVFEVAASGDIPAIWNSGVITDTKEPSSNDLGTNNMVTPKGTSSNKKKPYTAPVTLAPILPAGSAGIVPLTEEDQEMRNGIVKPSSPKVSSPSSSVEKPKVQSGKKAEREKNRLLRKLKSIRTK